MLDTLLDITITLLDALVTPQGRLLVRLARIRHERATSRVPSPNPEYQGSRSQGGVR